MKFSCDRCGKKYATAEAPAPGRVYKLRCKACGHLIVVKTPASGPAVTPAPSEPRAPAAASSPPEVDLSIEPAPPPAAEPPPPPHPVLTPVPTRSAEPTAEISMMAPLEEAKPPADGGYVDLFADSAPAATPPPPPQPQEPPPVADDPFMKAARGSLPDNFGGTAPLVDPFADMRDELDGPAAPPPAPAVTPVAPPPAPFPAAPPPTASDDKKKGGLPIALIGIGIAAVLGIVVVVALTSSKKTEPPPRPAPVVAPAPPPPPPPPAPEPQPEPKKVEPVKAEPKPEPRPEPKKREEKKVAKAEPKPEPKPKPPPPPPPPPKPEPKPVAKAEPEKPVQLPDAASALSPEAVQKVVNGSRKAFENCIEQASKKGGDIKFDGRRVSLRLNVNPNGFVTYPTLDDVTLNRTDLGECLKAAARLMVFPKFQGDVFHVEVPLVLR